MKCKVCQQGELSLKQGEYYDYLSQKTYGLFKCENCGCMQTQCDGDQKAYGAQYYGSQEGKFSWLMEKVFRSGHQLKAKKFYKKFHPGSVLEVGCGRGYMLLSLKSLGCQVHGLESAGAAEWILNNPEVPVKAIQDNASWPFEDNCFDLIIIWHVFEHVSEPRNVMLEMKRVLAPGGSICMSVPNIDSIQAGLGLKNWFHLDVPRHLFHFSSLGMEKLVGQTGLSINEVKAGDLLQNLYGWYQTLANMITPSNNNIVYRFLQGAEPWRSCKNKWLLIIHIITAPIIIPMAILGWLLETVVGRHGTMTYNITE